MKSVKLMIAVLLAGIMMAIAFTGCSQKIASLDDYLNSEQGKAEVQTTIDQAAEQGMDLEIYADGTTLCYDYNYPAGTVMPEDAAASIDTALDAGADTMNSVVKTLQSGVSQEGISIKVSYYDGEENLITSREFTGE